MIHSETNVEDQLRKIIPAADFAMFDCQRLKMFFFGVYVCISM